MSSNIVKWNYIQFDQQEKCVIDSDDRKEILADILSIPQEEVDVLLKRNVEKKKNKLIEETNEVHEEKLQEEERKRLEEEAEEILGHAKQEAENMIEAARQEADSIKESAYETGKEAGYEDGMRQSQQELLEQQQKLEEERNACLLEYHRLLDEAEPKFVDLLISLIEKITGLLLENKKEVILHLLHNGIRQIGRSDKYVIYCSSEDYLMVEEEKGRLCSAVGRTDGVEILEDSSFQKNQCIIETDNKILDCSLDIQLKELIESLKLLSIDI